MIRRIGVLTSGGDSPGMNAAIRSITRVALRNGIEVYGIRDGYKGIIEKKFTKFEKSSVSEIMSRGGTILGSARFIDFKKSEVVEQAAAILKENGIDALIAIGGDGTYHGALELTKKGVKCIALPGTIDNDIQGTDYTIGFDTALNTIVDCVDKLRDTSSSHHRCSVVEVMGNRCGDLALYSGLSCGAEVVISSDTGFDETAILDKLKYLDKQGKNHAIVIVSEKITDVNEFAKKISNNTNFDGRATVLGYIQRGGVPTPNDRVLASRMGEKAVDLLINNVGGHCVCVQNNKMVSLPIEEVLNLPRENKKDLYHLFETLV